MREKLIKLLTGYSIDTLADVEFVVEHLIANDVVPVVRCKDCVSFVPESITVCRHCAITKMQVVDEDDFCSYGERKDND